ncbi:CD99 antigen isoform X2 [Eleutherodactylus coqui]|uniref:CD99 antigen isoform X2 n=1 Tax=Eleutherodactylus coqui TaxID=57060 RepID=UPI003462D66F
MRLPVCCCLLLLVAAGGQAFDDLDLAQALPDDPTVKPKADDTHVATGGPVDIPKKPTTKPQPGFGDVPRKPTAKPQPGGDDPFAKPPNKPQPGHEGGGGGGDEFRLEDILGEDDPFGKPTNKPQPGREGGGGGGGGGVIADSDLGEVDPNHPSGHDDKPSGRAMQPSAGGGEQGQGGGGGGENQNIVAGIVGAVAAAAVGAVSSFIAYQKKKLCFKGATDDPEAVNMDSHKGDQSDPQVQSSLLEK